MFEGREDEVDVPMKVSRVPCFVALQRLPVFLFFTAFLGFFQMETGFVLLRPCWKTYLIKSDATGRRCPPVRQARRSSCRKRS